MRFVVAEGATSGKPAWWLLSGDGAKVAWSGTTFRDRTQAHKACAEFKAGALTWRYEIYLDAKEQPRWRAKDARGKTVALASHAFATRSLAVADAHRVRTAIAGAIGP